MVTIADLQERVYANNVRLTWRCPPSCPWPCPDHKVATFAEAMMLLVTEISEACDAWRKWEFADQTAAAVTVPAGEIAPPPPKPEGVGSEFADIFIRLIDDAHMFGVALRGQFPDLRTTVSSPLSFMENMLAMTAMVVRAGEAREWGYARGVEVAFASILSHLQFCAHLYGIDLMAEVQRKMAYNETRPVRHGGRQL